MKEFTDNISDLSDIIEKANNERQNGKQILVARMNKNKRFQKEQLSEQGYTNFEEFYRQNASKNIRYFQKSSDQSIVLQG